MQTKDFNHKLGAGIYSIPDVAFLLGLPTAKVRRWMNEFWDQRIGSEKNNRYSWGEGKEKATNFYTLIEFYVFYQLREMNISTKRIFSVHKEMREILKTPYPFASAKVLTDGKSVLFKMGDETIVHANRSRQIALKEIIESFCKKIEFSSSDIADRFYPMGKDKHIIVDPHHQFGQPIIEDTNILAETIYDFYKAGESVSFLVKLYHLSEADVRDAISLFEPKQAA